jgi:hypothetical protein
MDVTATDTAGTNANDDFIVRWLGVGKIDEFQFRWGGEKKSFHA